MNLVEDKFEGEKTIEATRLKITELDDEIDVIIIYPRK